MAYYYNAHAAAAPPTAAHPGVASSTNPLSSIGHAAAAAAAAAAAGHHHGSRSRRAPRLSSQGAHRPFRGVRSMKELTADGTNLHAAAAAAVVTANASAFRARFEACKGFELDDDLEFCPGLLTEDDLSSIPSSASDRSSLSSGSPSSSPLSHQAQPVGAHISPPYSMAAPSFQPSTTMAAQQPHHATPSMHPSASQHSQPPNSLKMHQPSALRTRKVIPIVNPSTGMRVASPPLSMSPARGGLQASYGRHW